MNKDLILFKQQLKIKSKEEKEKMFNDFMKNIISHELINIHHIPNNNIHWLRRLYVDDNGFIYMEMKFKTDKIYNVQLIVPFYITNDIHVIINSIPHTKYNTIDIMIMDKGFFQSPMIPIVIDHCCTFIRLSCYDIFENFKMKRGNV